MQCCAGSCGRFGGRPQRLKALLSAAVYGIAEAMPLRTQVVRGMAEASPYEIKLSLAWLKEPQIINKVQKQIPRD